MAERHPHGDRFDRWASRYDRSLLQPIYFRPLHRRLAALLSPAGGAWVLDVGCGTGNLTLRLAGRAGRAGHAVGVDPSEPMVRRAVAKRRAGPAGFALARAEALPFPHGSFDAAVSSVSVHHWADPEAGFREVARVLRPGGRFAVADMHRLSAPRRWILRARHPGHHEGWTPAELAGLLRRAGFHRVWAPALGWLRPWAVLLVAERA